MKKGQTLLETIVATLVVILLVTGLIVGTTAALKAAQSARRRSIGTKLTQEGIEHIRNMRDNGWNNFYAQNPTGTNTYCLGSSGTLNAGSCANNVSVTEGTLTFVYTRTARLSWDSVNNSMGVFVQVSWTEGSATRYSKAQTTLTNWR